jgi:hypothetical protein
MAPRPRIGNRQSRDNPKMSNTNNYTPNKIASTTTVTSGQASAMTPRDYIEHPEADPPPPGTPDVPDDIGDVAISTSILGHRFHRPTMHQPPIVSGADRSGVIRDG